LRARLSERRWYQLKMPEKKAWDFKFLLTTIGGKEDV
jgi:hypothetical protein